MAADDAWSGDTANSTQPSPDRPWGGRRPEESRDRAQGRHTKECRGERAFAERGAGPSVAARLVGRSGAGQGERAVRMPREEHHRVRVGEAVGFAADADVETTMSRRYGAERRAGVDRRARSDCDRCERQVADAPGTAGSAHDPLARGDHARVHDAPAASGAHDCARRRVEVDATMRTRSERRKSRA